MDVFKLIFPFSFEEKKEVKDLIITIVIYAVIGIVASVIMALLNQPVIGVLAKLLGTLIDLYVTGGIVFAILNYCKVIK